MLEIDNTAALEAEGSEGGYTPNKPGTYLARIAAIEADTSTFNGETKPQAKLRFELVKNAMSGKPVVDLDGKEYQPCERVLSWWGNAKTCYRWSGDLKKTQTGEVLELAGVDPFAAKPAIADALGKMIAVVITHQQKDDGSIREKITGWAAYENDDYEEVLMSLPPMQQA